jgi:hypothetical protein
MIVEILTGEYNGKKGNLEYDPKDHDKWCSVDIPNEAIIYIKKVFLREVNEDNKN